MGLASWLSFSPHCPLFPQSLPSVPLAAEGSLRPRLTHSFICECIPPLASGAASEPPWLLGYPLSITMVLLGHYMALYVLLLCEEARPFSELHLPYFSLSFRLPAQPAQLPRCIQYSVFKAHLVVSTCSGFFLVTAPLSTELLQPALWE